ncbi:serine/threonine-protein phosphatase 6 regulatory subunit 3-like [Pollicipes pollicipes]|uniref:serine/threonine-protein phosphatase 6 regulatory subunit 3-like n=1 Tax=Pollicipes pollicipes TaxID=41117 RepID=UPI0018852DED|nr:serine/threonine-protein phosphatase 6 regulatory subunit 3-like [Pollicipes pollicipes]
MAPDLAPAALGSRTAPVRSNVEGGASELGGSGPLCPTRMDAPLMATPRCPQIFTKTKLVQRILQGMEEPQTNGETSEQKRCCRSLRAYCGHLVNMANKICSACEKGPNAELVQRQLDALPEPIRAAWQAFKEAKLNRINEQNKPVLPDTKQDSSSDSDYRGVTDAQQAAILRTFHNFQLLTPRAVGAA